MLLLKSSACACFCLCLCFCSSPARVRCCCRCCCRCCHARAFVLECGVWSFPALMTTHTHTCGSSSQFSMGASMRIDAQIPHGCPPCMSARDPHGSMGAAAPGRPSHVCKFFSFMQVSPHMSANSPHFCYPLQIPLPYANVSPGNIAIFPHHSHA